MKLKHIFLSVALSGTLASCNFLEVEPVTDITEERFWRTASDVEAAVIGLYDGLQNFTYSRDVVFVSAIRSDEMNVRSGGNNNNFASFDPPPAMNPVAEFWRESYFAIHRCQDVIENAPRVNDVALNKDKALGEAHFIRALLYFNLVRNYGPIPIIPETTKGVSDALFLSRRPVNEVYDLIVSDLLEAERLINVPPVSRAYASKGAAQALLARVYLHRQAAGDIERALQKCEQVMADNSYRLVARADYATLFALGQQNTPETIFMISYQPSVQLEGASNLYRETVSSDFNNPRGEPTPKILAAINADPNDIRRTLIGRHRNINYTKKYEPVPPNQPRVTDVNIIVLRLADVILMRAECLNRLGRTPEAIPFLNQIRVRAGLPPTTATSTEQVALAIENERFVELAFEGHRYYDLVRTNRLQLMNSRLTDPARILWPIPLRELQQNPNLEQNPSYPQ